VGQINHFKKKERSELVGIRAKPIPKSRGANAEGVLRRYEQGADCPISKKGGSTTRREENSEL